MISDIEDFPGYQVTVEGVVIGKRLRRPMSPIRRQRGYMKVRLWRGRRRYERDVHTLVARAFLGPRPDGLEVRHLNGDPGDNRLVNLAYGTPTENNLDTIAHGRHMQTNQTHCVNGHEFTPENTVIRRLRGRNPYRQCRECRRLWHAEKRTR